MALKETNDSLKEINKAIEERDIDKVLSLFPRVDQKDYNKLINKIEVFLNKEMMINKTVYNLNMFYYNRTVQKRTPREGCFEYLYVHEGKIKYRPKDIKKD
ncbi:hypothetical protein NGRA_1624 [Nosema granulosis]|uniref:Uncharacterized protein n=1 Tax=Nosema granulosis TaxID=83296 RepID=A0A9P6GY68_9MICR|nr:hypothetical protein NGRA_1624 [Nosema granulosis]